MPALTRKQINEQPERWQIYYAGVRAGLIQQRSGAERPTCPGCEKSHESGKPIFRLSLLAELMK